jgi:hypothetical protein
MKLGRQRVSFSRDVRFRRWFVSVFAAFAITAAVAMAATAPRNWIRATTIHFSLGASLKLSHNSPETIKQEILDTNTVRLIAKSNGLSDQDLSTVQIAQPSAGRNWVDIYHVEGPERAFKLLSEQLRNYVHAREEGHTRAFLLAAITNRAEASTISDPDLRAVATNRVMLPISWLKKARSGTTTNKAGQVVSKTVSTTRVDGRTVTNETKQIPQVDEVCRWVSYTLVDGEVAWTYFVMFKANASLDYIHDSRCDAKEYDPNYQKVIKEVDDEVHGEMERNGGSGQFGSVHSFWHLKKQKLKAKGIEWRSPSELNPNTIYD